MIVEDEVVIALLLETFVIKLGLEVVGVVDHYEAAVELFEQTRPDVVLMDVSIAGKRDGVETAKALRALREVPTIFLTAYTDPTTVERMRACAPYGYLSKPFDATLLENMLRSALSSAARA